MTILTAELDGLKGGPARLIFVPGSVAGCGTARIEQKRSSVEYVVYTVRELPTELGGRAFRFLKPTGEAGSDPEGRDYDVQLAAGGPECECRGFLRHGRNGTKCKHILAVEHMVRHGWI